MLRAWGGAWKATAWAAGSWEGAEAPPAVVEAAVTGGWPDHRPPSRRERDEERRRLGILPPLPAPKRAPAPAPAATEAPAAEPYEWRAPDFSWTAAADAARLARTLDQLADEARFADLVAAGRIAAAVAAAEARLAELQREEQDMVYVLAALAAGQGAPVALQVQADARSAAEEQDMVFVIATLASIA